jgi:hypothetical protein
MLHRQGKPSRCRTQVTSNVRLPKTKVQRQSKTRSSERSCVEPLTARECGSEELAKREVDQCHVFELSQSQGNWLEAAGPFFWRFASKHPAECKALGQRGCRFTSGQVKTELQSSRLVRTESQIQKTMACPIPLTYPAVAASRTWSPHSSAPNVSLTLR